MVGVPQKLVKLVLAVRGGKHMRLTAHFLFAQPRLEKAAGGAAVEIFPNQRIEMEHRERLLRQKDAAARLIFHPRQYFQILREPSLIHDIRRRRRLPPNVGHVGRGRFQSHNASFILFVHAIPSQ